MSNFFSQNIPNKNIGSNNLSQKNTAPNNPPQGTNGLSQLDVDEARETVEST